MEYYIDPVTFVTQKSGFESKYIKNLLGLLDEGATIPFISRICADRVVTANKKNPNRSPFFNREMSLQNEWVSWSFILLLVLV